MAREEKLGYGKFKSQRRVEGTVPCLREQGDVIALCVGDIHLSHKPPLAREDENWYEAMSRPLKELSRLAEKYQAPVIIAGDVFDRWNSPPELINFAIETLWGYAIPGQHDLPYHNLEEIRKSAFWTLYVAGKITVVDKPIEVDTNGVALRLHPFPFGCPLQPLANPHDLCIEIAVVHSYMWCNGAGYKDAPSDCFVGNLKKQVKGYDIVVVGDNHIPWECQVGNTLVFNCGGFYRRKADEVNHKPSIGLLHKDKTITRHYLDISQDKFANAKKLAKLLPNNNENMEAFIKELEELSDTDISFPEAVKQYMFKQGVDKKVQKIVMGWLRGEGI